MQAGKSCLPHGWALDTPQILLESLTVKIVDYTPDIEERMLDTNLVICHAGKSLPLDIFTCSPLKPCMEGAGSVLAALRGPPISSPDARKTKRPFIIVVPNDTLMDNHQSQLSRELVKQNLAYSSTSQLQDLLLVLDQLGSNALNTQKPLEKPNTFVDLVDQLMGYSKVS